MKRYAFPLSLVSVPLLMLAFAFYLPSQTAPATPAGPNTPAVVYVSTDPTGSCTMNNLNQGSSAPVFVTLNVNTGLISRCKAGTWVNGDVAAGFQIGDGTDATKVLKFTTSGASTGTTATIADAVTANRTITLPDPGGAASLFYANATTAQNLLVNSFNVADNTDATKQIAFQASGATTATKETVAVAQAANVTVTLPKNAGGIAVVQDCGAGSGATYTCANNAVAATAIAIMGKSTLAANAQVVTFSPGFTSTSTYQCVANDVTTRANPVQMVQTSATSATITNTTGATDAIQWMCLGY